MNLALYLVTRRNTLCLEDFFNIIKSALLGGVTMVQLREKHISDHEMIVLGKQLLLLLKPFKVPLIINDRINVARVIGAQGVHLGQSDSSVAEARKILGKKAIIGLSIESLDQIKKIKNEEVSYIAASPVFHTTTKTDCKQPLGLQGLKQLCSLSRHPVIAIGGINKNNIKQVLECGAVGVAVISAIFNSLNPTLTAQSMLSKVKQYVSGKME